MRARRGEAPWSVCGSPAAAAPARIVPHRRTDSDASCSAPRWRLECTSVCAPTCQRAKTRRCDDGTFQRIDGATRSRLVRVEPRSCATACGAGQRPGPVSRQRALGSRFGTRSSGRARDAAEAASRAPKSRVPRQHEPRDPHADERRDRHDRAAARHASSTPRAARATPRPSALGARALLTIINDILDFSKIEAGKLELERDRLRPARGRRGGARAAAPSARTRKGLELACLRRAATCPQRVRGDPGRLRQVLINLVGNAIKFTERGEVVVDASSATRAARPDVRAALRGRATPASASPREPRGRAVRALHAGRRLDHARVRRHRARARDLASSSSS